MSTRAAFWVNAALFELVWFATIIGAARGDGWIGPLAVTAFAAYQIPAGRCARADAALVAAAIGVGFLVDTLFARTGLIVYAAATTGVVLAPVWIVALWANLALTLNHSLAFLRANLVVAAVFGAIGGPLSYFFAARTWLAVTLAQPTWRSLLAIALVWALAMPLLAAVARRLRRDDPASAALRAPVTP